MPRWIPAIRACPRPIRRHGMAARATRTYIFLLGWLLGWLLPFPAAALPERFSAAYTLSARNMTIGQVAWSLAPIGDGHYRYDAVTSPKGALSLFYKSRRSEHSRWRYRGGRIQPLVYRYDREGRKDRKVEVIFDWGQGIARNILDGETWQMPLPVGTLDKNVYVLALMRDLDKGHRDLEYPIADGGRIKTYRFSSAGEERIDTALGRVETVLMERIRKAAARKTTFWCAPRFGYLPVKVRHREKDGTIIILRIAELEGIEPK